jgi:hypothetical protein
MTHKEDLSCVKIHKVVYQARVFVPTPHNMMLPRLAEKPMVSKMRRTILHPEREM